MWEKYFRIADHNVVIKGINPEGENTFPFGFKTFERTRIENQLPLFTLETGVSLSADATPAHYTFLFEELGLTCEFVVGKDIYEFRMLPNVDKIPSNLNIDLLSETPKNSPIILKMPRNGFYYTTNLLPTFEAASEFRFLVWNAYGVAAASLASFAIHSSAVIYKGRTVLFLGESGTGKSTHAQLWLKTIKDCKLLNDDSPIVRIVEGTPICFGSPWSGKGNFFRNESYPIAAVVRLRQARFNHIRRLNRIEAFTALYPSCPPSFSADSELTDHICNTLSVLIEKVPVYLLDCLPDTDAALLSFSTIFFGHDDIISLIRHE